MTGVDNDMLAGFLVQVLTPSPSRFSSLVLSVGAGESDLMLRFMFASAAELDVEGGKLVRPAWAWKYTV